MLAMLRGMFPACAAEKESVEEEGTEAEPVTAPDGEPDEELGDRAYTIESGRLS